MSIILKSIIGFEYCLILVCISIRWSFMFLSHIVSHSAIWRRLCTKHLSKFTLYNEGVNVNMYYQTLSNRGECHRSSEMPTINRCSLSSLNGRVNVKIWSSSSVMLTSPYEWKILEWDVKPPTNKLKCNIVL